MSIPVFNQNQISRIVRAVKYVERLMSLGIGAGGQRWQYGYSHRPTKREYLFAVKVWRDGGATDGDASNPCDRTYLVKTIDATDESTGGETLGTGMTPKIVRPATGKLVTPATTGQGKIGAGYYDGDNVFMLWHANETLDPAPC